MGIYHVDQIASWGPGEIAWVDDNFDDFRGRATRDEWVAQARELSSGSHTDASKRVDDGDAHP